MNEGRLKILNMYLASLSGGIFFLPVRSLRECVVGKVSDLTEEVFVKSLGIKLTLKEAFFQHKIRNI